MILQVSKMAKVLHVRQDPAIVEDMIGGVVFLLAQPVNGSSLHIYTLMLPESQK